MSQIVIDTDAIKKAVLYFFALVGVLAVAGIIVLGVTNHYSIQPVQQTIVPASTPETVIPPPVTSPAQHYPYVTEFTVVSTTVANGHYQALATSGQTFNIPDFTTWNSLWPRNTYTATITGTEADGSLDVTTINRLSSTISPVTGGVQALQYPYVIEFTVLSTTIVNGNYAVLATDGKTLYFTDFSTWDTLHPRYTYTGTVIGVESNGAYDIGTVNLVSTALYYQRGVYLFNDDYWYSRSPVYRPPVNDPPVYHPPVNTLSVDPSVIDPPLEVSLPDTPPAAPAATSPDASPG
jgi:hypothetical protein